MTTQPLIMPGVQKGRGNGAIFFFSVIMKTNPNANIVDSTVIPLLIGWWFNSSTGSTGNLGFQLEHVWEFATALNRNLL